MPRANSNWTFGEAKLYAAQDAVVEAVAVKLMKRFCRKRDILKLGETHRAILLGSKTEAFVSSFLRKQSLKLVLGCVDRKVADIQRIARWILVSKVDQWEAVAWGWCPS